jgi:hypothetical protein
MNVTSEQVELIVQRVLEHLGMPAGARPSTNSSTTNSATNSSNSPPATAAAPKGARISDHVVTQALLADAVNGSKQVRIGPRAILTPSARDFVRTRGIEIIREPAQAKSVSTTRWQIIVATSTPQIAAAIEGLKERGIACDLRLVGLPAEAAAQAIGALCRGEANQIVVFTSQPEVVACLSNRNDRIRAAAVADVTAVERVEKNLNANLLAIDPSGKSLHELKACLKAYITV